MAAAAGCGEHRESVSGSVQNGVTESPGRLNPAAGPEPRGAKPHAGAGGRVRPGTEGREPRPRAGLALRPLAAAALEEETDGGLPLPPAGRRREVGAEGGPWRWPRKRSRCGSQASGAGWLHDLGPLENNALQTGLNRDSACRRRSSGSPLGPPIHTPHSAGQGSPGGALQRRQCGGHLLWFGYVLGGWPQGDRTADQSPSSHHPCCSC